MTNAKHFACLLFLSNSPPLPFLLFFRSSSSSSFALTSLFWLSLNFKIMSNESWPDTSRSGGSHGLTKPTTVIVRNLLLVFFASDTLEEATHRAILSIGSVALGLFSKFPFFEFQKQFFFFYEAPTSSRSLGLTQSLISHTGST